MSDSTINICFVWVLLKATDENVEMHSLEVGQHARDVVTHLN